MREITKSDVDLKDQSNLNPNDIIVEDDFYDDASSIKEVEPSGSESSEEQVTHHFDIKAKDTTESQEIILMPVPSDPTEGFLLSAGAPSIHLAFFACCWAFNKKAEVDGDKNMCTFQLEDGPHYEAWDYEF